MCHAEAPRRPAAEPCEAAVVPASAERARSGKVSRTDVRILPCKGHPPPLSAPSP